MPKIIECDEFLSRPWDAMLRLLWTAQGHFLVENSEASTINRNTGMFWALLQCSLMVLIHLVCFNELVYFNLPLSDSSRKNIFLSLLIASVLGTLSFLVLRKNHHEEEMLSEEEGQSLLSAGMIVFSSGTILELVKSKTILLLSPCMAYSGLELSFYSGVYGTCIGATAQFGDAAKGLIGISGIVVGIGEIVGKSVFNNRFRRTSVVFLGMVVHFVAFYLIFLNIPDDAPVVIKTNTQKNPYLSPSASIALLCSFLLGLGDSCFNTQLYSILGRVYAEQSTPAFAIFKFIQSVFAAVAFFYSGYLMLMWQLLLMIALGFTGTLCFFMVERIYI
uniref:Major facilitator superfamily domain containing 11 n=1 Tax=Sphaeramia orbicularis TaxID=375764 RepID=A0A672YBK5_9TELE